jgi:hypothetical protein
VFRKKPAQLRCPTPQSALQLFPIPPPYRTGKSFFDVIFFVFRTTKISKVIILSKKSIIFLIDCTLVFINLLMKMSVLALMEAASFCAGVQHKRYSVQQEVAPNN